MRVLNVGGGPKGVSDIPAKYKDWEVVLLDIDPNVKPDLLLDARLLSTQEPEQYDAAYASHVLEHFHCTDALKVLAGIYHILKPDGYVEMFVPNVSGAIQHMQKFNLSFHDTWYRTPADIAISFHDVIYGWSLQVECGNDYYCHKQGFSPKSFGDMFHSTQFKSVWVGNTDTNIHALAFKKEGVPCPLL